MLGQRSNLFGTITPIFGIGQQVRHVSLPFLVRREREPLSATDARWPLPLMTGRYAEPCKIANRDSMVRPHAPITEDGLAGGGSDPDAADRSASTLKILTHRSSVSGALRRAVTRTVE
jgi:hypothetical protein